MKLGRKATTEHLVVYMSSGNESDKPRFGFVVGKTVGNSVERNRVKRRARSLAQANLASFDGAQNIVIRTLPGTAQTSWQELSEEFSSALSRLKAAKA
jgi:ribonuclease P protein component